MKPIVFRDLMVEAFRTGDSKRIDQLAVQLAEAEEIKRLHQALSHCPECVAAVQREIQHYSNVTKPPAVGEAAAASGRFPKYGCQHCTC